MTKTISRNAVSKLKTLNLIIGIVGFIMCAVPGFMIRYKYASFLSTGMKVIEGVGIALVAFGFIFWALCRRAERHMREWGTWDMDARQFFMGSLAGPTRRNGSGGYGGYGQQGRHGGFGGYGNNGYSNGNFYNQQQRTTQQSDIMSPASFDGKYSYFYCRDCGTKIRIPMGTGVVMITCPKCQKKFKAKS